MSDFINCPACRHRISTDDFADDGMHDFKTWEQECPECEESIEVTAMIEIRYQVNTN